MKRFLDLIFLNLVRLPRKWAMLKIRFWKMIQMLFGPFSLYPLDVIRTHRTHANAIHRAEDKSFSSKLIFIVCRLACYFHSDDGVGALLLQRHKRMKDYESIVWHSSSECNFLLLFYQKNGSKHGRKGLRCHFGTNENKCGLKCWPVCKMEQIVRERQRERERVSIGSIIVGGDGSDGSSNSTGYSYRMFFAAAKAAYYFV